MVRLTKGIFDQKRDHPQSQHTLPMHDESIDERVGWTGVKPVTEYHGTTDAPGVNVGGLEGKVMSRHRAVKPPAGLEGEPVVYTTSDKEKAREWAKQRAKTLGTDPAKVGVYGVRGGDLESTEQEDSKSQFGGATTRVHSPNIPRERMTVVKHSTSPDALRHKRAYQANYQKKPDRIKYREELIKERRKRGIYGKGGPDMSHTKQHTLVAEDPHANRARHFKGRGTLKSVAVRKMTEEEAWALEEQLLGREGSARRLKEPRGRRRHRSEGIKVTDSQDWGKIKEARRDKEGKRSVDRELFSQPTGTPRKRSLVTARLLSTTHPGPVREEVYREHQIPRPGGMTLSRSPYQGPVGALRTKFHSLNPNAPLGFMPSDEADIREEENEEGKPVMTMGPVYEEFGFNEWVDEMEEARRQWDKNAARMGLSNKPEAPLVTSPYAHRFDEEGERQEQEPAISERDALRNLNYEAAEDVVNTALAGNTPHYLFEEHESGLVPTFRGLPERTASQSMFGVPFIRSESPAPKLVGVKKANDVL